MATLYESMNDTFSQVPMKIYRHNLSGSYIWAPLHWHRSVEIFVAFSGKLRFTVGSQNLLIQGGDWLFVNSCQLHACRYIDLSDDFYGISFVISLPFLETWLGKELFFYNPGLPKVTQQVFSISHKLQDLTDEARFFPIQVMEEVFQFLHLMGEFCIQPDTSYAPPLFREQALAGQILEYIENNFTADLPLSETAAYFQYSPGYFSRFFKSLIGMNYNAYVNYVRVQHAAAGLLHSQPTITSCALENGFSDTKSFIRTFRKIYGCTPGKFLQ